VAISDGPIQVDFVVEALWPEVPADVGRRRLRNVLTRVKVATGALIVRSGESLSLSEGTTVDLAEFDAAYARVGRALPSARLSLARAALALYGARCGKTEYRCRSPSCCGCWPMRRTARVRWTLSWGCGPVYTRWIRTINGQYSGRSSS
jgi:hypothetical protein